MKYLLMCEGSNEERLLELLLDNDKLIISRDDLIGRKPYHIRQLNNPFVKTMLKHYNKPVIIYRIGDKQSDKFPIPKDLRNIVSQDRIFKYCTKPELEILLIINEKLYDEFRKSRNKSPKSFAKENIIYNRRYYDQSSDYLIDYYSEKRISMLIDNLQEYKRIKKHNKDELYLVDLLKT